MSTLKMMRSFRFAANGIKIFFQAENNAKFHLLAIVITLSLGFYLKLSATEWAIILTQIGMVLAAEALNTAIEKLCDYVSPEYQVLIGKVKDLAAGGVLIASIIAAIVGCLVFLPKIFNCL